MSSPLRVLHSSIGRKILMAVSGLILVGFVIGHLVGNLQVFQDPDHINGYGQFLHGLGPLLWAARLVITAGAWATELLMDIGVPLKVMRRGMLWIDVSANPYMFRRDHFPMFIAETPQGDFYGLPEPTNGGFQRVSLKPEDRRGGLLTMGAVLGLTSDGTRHRPVHRGVWLSEAILGKTPPPPPANVPAATAPRNRNRWSCAICTDSWKRLIR